MLTTNNNSSLNKVMKDRCVLVEMNAASTGLCYPLPSVVADMKVVLNNKELTAEIYAAKGSLREVMNRVKCLARRKQSQSTI